MHRSRRRPCCSQRPLPPQSLQNLHGTCVPARGRALAQDTRVETLHITYICVQRARTELTQSADYTVNLTHLTHTFLPSRHARNIGTLSTTAVICVVHELRAAQQQSLRRAAPQFSINQHPPFSPLPVAPTLQLVLILSSCGGGLPDREKQALSAARWQVGDVARARESIGDLLRL